MKVVKDAGSQNWLKAVIRGKPMDGACTVLILASI